MSKTRVLITGASGFVGRNTAEHLSSTGKYEVFACTDPVADLRDPEAVRRVIGEFGPDCVINCAAVVATRKTAGDQAHDDLAATNLRMFFNIVRSLAPQARLLQLGSGAEYDNRAYQPKMREDFFDTSVPADPYGFSKYVMSRYAACAENITVLRIFGIFGKYEDYTFKFISNAIVKNLLGLPITINQNVRFDYLNITDFVRMAALFIEAKPKFRHYNVTPTETADLVSLAGLINKASGKPVEVSVLNPGLNREYSGDNARFLAEFPGFEFTSYEQGIRELYAYYRGRLGELDLARVKEDPYIRNCRKI